MVLNTPVSPDLPPSQVLDASGSATSPGRLHQPLQSELLEGWGTLDPTFLSSAGSSPAQSFFDRLELADPEVGPSMDISSNPGVPSLAEGLGSPPLHSTSSTLRR